MSEYMRARVSMLRDEALMFSDYPMAEECEVALGLREGDQIQAQEHVVRYLDEVQNAS